MRKFNVSKSAAIGFGLTLAVLLVGGGLGYLNAGRLKDSSECVNHSHSVIGALETLVSMLKDAETGQRGYLLVNDEKYLEPYEDALRQIYVENARLKELISDNPEQQARLALLDRKIDLRLNVLKQTVALLKQGDRPAALKIVNSGIGKNLMDDLRREIAAMQQVEQDLLRKRSNDAKISYRIMVGTIIICAMIGGMFVIGVFVLSRRTIMQRQRVAEDLFNQNECLRKEIIDREQAESALVASESRYRSLTEFAPVGIVQTDHLGDLVFANECWCKLAGLTLEAAQGQGWATAVHPDDRERIRSEWLAAAAAEKSYVCQFRFQTPQGQITWVHVSTRTLSDGKGQMVGHLATVTDVTDIKVAEDNIRKSEARLRLSEQHLQHERAFINAMLEALPGMLFVIDEQPRFKKWNRAIEQVTGHSAEEIASISPLDILAAEEQKRTGKTLRNAFEKGRDDIETHVLAQDGKKIPYYFSAERFTTGTEQFVVGIGVDISTQKRLEEQNRQAQKMEVTGLLAGGVAHDFNNLLAVILGCCEFLENDATLNSDSRELVEDIYKAGSRAATLTRQLLAFSRQQILQPKVLNLNEVVTETGRMLERLIGEDIALTSSLSSRLWPVKVDTGQMEQVLVNLAVNARDAMPQGGKLTIETANVELDEQYFDAHLFVKAGQYVMLSVSDTGCGMDEKTRARIFEPFFTTKAVGKGTGLGLATVFGIIKQSGGHIMVYSELGHGTAFKIYLPKIETVFESSGPEKPQPALARGTETVLVVEDEDGVRNLACRILRSQGYTVLEARNGGEALLAFQDYEGTIELVLTDVVMPEMGGRQMHERLLATQPNLAALFMSGYTDDAVMRHGVLESETNFIQKPFSYAALANAVRDVLDRQGSKANACFGGQNHTAMTTTAATTSND